MLWLAPAEDSSPLHNPSRQERCGWIRIAALTPRYPGRQRAAVKDRRKEIAREPDLCRARRGCLQLPVAAKCESTLRRGADSAGRCCALTSAAGRGPRQGLSQGVVAAGSRPKLIADDNRRKNKIAPSQSRCATLGQGKLRLRAPTATTTPVRGKEQSMMTLQLEERARSTADLRGGISDAFESWNHRNICNPARHRNSNSGAGRASADPQR